MLRTGDVLVEAESFVEQQRSKVSKGLRLKDEVFELREAAAKLRAGRLQVESLPKIREHQMLYRVLKGRGKRKTKTFC